MGVTCPPCSGGMEALNTKLKEAGFQLNTSGGELKVSPDGGLLQSSTVSEQLPFTFAGGEEREVAGAYIEFAERKALPEFEHIPVGAPACSQPTPCTLFGRHISIAECREVMWCVSVEHTGFSSRSVSPRSSSPALMPVLVRCTQ